MSNWIVIPNWERFQHYRKRRPPWIKVYTELMAKDEYRELTLAERGLLHGIWLEYARSHGKLRGDTASLSRRLGERVLNTQLTSLSDAGFIEVVASKPLAIRAHATEAEAEKSSMHACNGKSPLLEMGVGRLR